MIDLAIYGRVVHSTLEAKFGSQEGMRPIA